MKKKLTVTTVLVLLLAMCLTMLVGCDEMFTKNEERDGMQVVATVHYEGETANIYKFELASQFNNYAYAYHNYYQMSYEDIANYFAQSLAQQKLLAMYARHKVTELMDLDAAPEDIAELLTRSELNRAIENTNEGLMTVLKSRVEESVNEDYYNSGTDNDSSDKKDEEEDVEITDGVNVSAFRKATKRKNPKNPPKRVIRSTAGIRAKIFLTKRNSILKKRQSATLSLFMRSGLNLPRRVPRCPKLRKRTIMIPTSTTRPSK